jgi:transcriptional regulator with XRE-family HTH domain
VSRRKKRQREAEVFGAAVRRLREAQGWTQEQLAERAEMNASYLGFIERGDNVPTLMIIVNLAKAFDVEPGILLRDVMRLR